MRTSFLGYYNNTEATAATIKEDGWLYTGDLGYYDDELNFFIIDRLKELKEEGVIGSVADYHYSFGTPLTLEENITVAKELADLLKKDQVNAVLLFPV